MFYGLGLLAYDATFHRVGHLNVVPKIMRIIISIFMLVSGIAYAIDEKEWVECSAELMTFENERFYSMEILLEDTEDGTTTDRHISRPMVEFRRPDGVYGSDYRIKVLFPSTDDRKADMLEVFRRKNAIGRTFTLQLPRDFFETRYGSIEYRLIGKINTLKGTISSRREPSGLTPSGTPAPVGFDYFYPLSGFDIGENFSYLKNRLGSAISAEIHASENRLKLMQRLPEITWLWRGSRSSHFQRLRIYK